MSYHAQIGTNIAKAQQYLEHNDLVGIPTETVYGLAGNALSEEAVLKIFQVKNRPSFDPLIVHIPSVEKLNDYCLDIPESAYKLANAFWPGPLTLLLNKKSCIPDLVTSGLDRVAIRIPNHKITLDLLTQLNLPLAAPSANPFGYISPTQASHVTDQLGDQIPYVLEGGSCAVGVESTIVGWENGIATIYRLGGLSIEAIEACIGKVSIQAHSSSNPSAPGMLKSHYAPRIPIRLVEDIETYVSTHSNESFAILSYNKQYTSHPNQVLTLNNDLEEASKNLFAHMRTLDQIPVNYIITEKLPNVGLGRAINDRILRACAEK
jgi:L-threonylcarbamoyladenylate synthase